MKKLICLNIVFILLFSTVVFASSIIVDDNQTPFASISIQDISEADTDQEVVVDISDYLLKEYVTSGDLEPSEYVTFLKPEVFSEPISAIRDSFTISLRALTGDLVVKLFIYDEKEGIFVPVKRNVYDNMTDQNVVVNTAWRFGFSGFLLCTFRIPAEGIYDYRLIIHKAKLLEEEFVTDENLQIADFTIIYKKAVSFESILTSSFWDIYFDISKYSFPILP